VSQFHNSELWQILKLALPIVVSRASYAVMLFIDRFFLSQVGKFELAATLSGGLTTLVITSFFEGLVGYATAFVAQYYGANRQSMCVHATIQALYIAMFSYPIMLCFVPIIKFVFVLFGQDTTLIGLATVYSQILLGGSIFLVLRVALGSFFIGIGKTRVIMIANILGMVVSVPLNYIFIFGRLGFPEMGVTGAALGTICGSAFTFFVLLFYFVHETSTLEFQTSNFLMLLPSLIKRQLRFGIPTGVSPFLNWLAFNVFVQIIQAYGEDTAAAATIAFNWDSLAFVPMVGLGVAATTVVGQYIGAQDYEGAQRAVQLTLRIAVFYATVMMILWVGFAEPLTSVFASGLDGSTGKMATTMLQLVGLFTLANAIKLVLNGALRAAGDTYWSMYFAISVHWAMAFATVFLVRVVYVHQFVAFTTLILMNNIHCLGLIYRFRAGEWRTLDLIGHKAKIENDKPNRLLSE
jgi:multidrug resistance protein, MATE family